SMRAACSGVRSRESGIGSRERLVLDLGARPSTEIDSRLPIPDSGLRVRFLPLSGWVAVCSLGCLGFLGIRVCLFVSWKSWRSLRLGGSWYYLTSFRQGEVVL